MAAGSSGKGAPRTLDQTGKRGGDTATDSSTWVVGQAVVPSPSVSAMSVVGSRHIVQSQLQLVVMKQCYRTLWRWRHVMNGPA